LEFLFVGIRLFYVSLKKIIGEECFSIITQFCNTILFDFFFTFLVVLIPFRYTKFRNSEHFPLAGKVFFHKVKMKIHENHRKDAAESRSLFFKIKNRLYGTLY